LTAVVNDDEIVGWVDVEVAVKRRRRRCDRQLTAARDGGGRGPVARRRHQLRYVRVPAGVDRRRRTVARRLVDVGRDDEQVVVGWTLDLHVGRLTGRSQALVKHRLHCTHAPPDRLDQQPIHTARHNSSHGTVNNGL